MQIHRSAPGVPRGMFYAAKCSTENSSISENDEADSKTKWTVAKFKMLASHRDYICRFIEIGNNYRILQSFMRRTRISNRFALK